MFRYKNYQIYFLILGLLLLLRSYHSFFNLSVGDHDWTFLVVGRSLRNGYLPFLDTWTARGPVVFIFYAIPFFFKNFIFALKTMGIISIWLTSIIMYLISNRLFGKNAAIFASFGLALVASSEISFLTSDTEIFILPFISLFIYFIFFDINKPSNKHIVLAAIFISLATLMRPALGLVAFCGIFVFIFSEKKKFIKILIYIMSGLIPLLLVIILYASQSNGLEILWRSTVEMNSAFSAGRPIFLGAFIFTDSFANKQWYALFVVGLISILINKNHQREIMLMLLFLIVILFGFIPARKFSEYYMLLTLPFFVLMVSRFFDSRNNFPKIVSIIIIAVTLLGPLTNNITEQIKLKFRPLNGTIILHKVLKDDIKESETIFSLDNGLYLLFNKSLPTETAHPADLFRYPLLRVYYNDPNYNTEIALSSILDKKPDNIVMQKHWEDKLPEKIYERIKSDYDIHKFITKEELVKLKKVNKKYIAGITLYKIKN